MSSKVTYRQQYTRCGKERCRKCREGTGHGPYWYAYWSEKGRTVSKYVGTNLPEEVAVARQQSQAKEVEEQGELPHSGPLPVVEIAPAPILRVYVLGQFRVERKNGGGWSAIDSRIWHRRRVRALLGCLLSSTGRRLSREQVMEMLWPDLDIDVAANRLNGAVHELRQILEPEIARPAASRMLRLERDILEIADRTQIWVDAEAFEQLLKDARNCPDPDEAERLLEEAASFYRGGYLLEELYSEWATHRRDALHRAWVGLLLELAHVRAARGALASAIDALDRLRTAEPSNETALQRLMILLTRLDRRGEALQVYRQHVTLLERDDEIDLLPETQELYDELRQGKIPAMTGTKMSLAAVTAKEREVLPQQPITSPLSPVQEPAFVRPVLHLGRHNQSPLIGRQQEVEAIWQVLQTLEDVGAHDEVGARFISPPNTQEPSVDDTPIGTRFISPSGSRTLPPLSTPSRQRRPHFLLLMGEPGIGKTRLAEEFSLAAYKREWAVAWSRSYEQEGTIPYRPWTELLRGLLQGSTTFEELLAATHAPAHAVKLERLSPLLSGLSVQPAPGLRSSSSQPHEQERLHLWEATLGLLDTLSSLHPLLLVFDDLHWADESSIELLTYLTHHLQDQRVLLLATCRDVELPVQHKLRSLIADLQREQTMVMLSVHPLTQSQIGTLVSYLPEHMIESVQSQAAGNPFFAEELARYVGMLSHEGVQVLPTAVQQAAWPGGRQQATAYSSVRASGVLPEAIAAVLERRLGRLSSDCQALLGKAAVLGGSFALDQLLPMASELTEDVVLDLLDEALHAGLVTEEGMGGHILYHFWHPLIVSHLYEGLSAARRAHLHRKAAEVMKGTDTGKEKKAAAVVYHLSRGGGDPTDMAQYAELAGNQAYMIAAYSEAQQYYLQAVHAVVEGVSQGTEGNDVHGSIHCITSQMVGRLSIVMRLYVCRLLERIAECAVVHGNFEDTRYLYECILAVRVRRDFQEYVASLDGEGGQMQMRQEAERQALLWREIGNAWSATGEYAHAYECYGRGKEVMRSAGVSTGIAWACVHLQYGMLLRLDGQYFEAQRYLQEALTMLEECVYPMPGTIAMPFLVQGEYDTAMRKYEGFLQKQVPTRIERTLRGDPFELGIAHECLGIVLASSGPLSEGLMHMHVALTMYEEAELLSEMARVCSNLGAVSLVKGEQVLAGEYLRRALDLAERIGDLPNMVIVTGNLGDVAQRSGALLEAEGWFRRSLELAERVNDREGMSWGNSELAGVLRDMGKLKEARECLLRALRIGHTMKSRRCIRYALVGSGELRIVEAMLACPSLSAHDPGHIKHVGRCKELLLRARSTLQRALSLDELEVEAFTDGRRLQAMVCYLLGEEGGGARQMALQTLKTAQENETGRVVGRANHLLGCILAGEGYDEQAALYFEQALTIFLASGLRLDYARALADFGVVLVQDGALLSPGRDGEACQRGKGYLYEAREIFAECGAALDVMWTDGLISSLSGEYIKKSL